MKSIAWLRTAALAVPMLMTSLGGAGTTPATPGLTAFWDGGQPMPSLAPMLERVMPAVVNISTRARISTQENPLFKDPFFRYFFEVPNRPRERDTQSLGSGVIVDAERGYILTNYHVVEKAQDITVTLNDRRRIKAQLVGRDPETDVALLKIPADHLTALPIGDSDALRVGDYVAAIGNPFGLGQTVTSGIVSAVGRSGLGIEGYEDFIQTDASINPGNSGGPLVNLRGELVGINAAILTPGGGNIGIGFAVPANMAHAVMEQLAESGEVRRGRLGVVAQDLIPEIASSWGTEMLQGAMVTQFESSSVASRSGLKVGDIITSVNGRPVRSAAGLRNRVALFRVGDKVTLDVLRDGKRIKVHTMVATPRTARVEGAKIDPRLAGATFTTINTTSGPAVQVSEVEADSLTHYAGLREGDIVLAANRMPVSDIASLRSAAQRSQRSLLLDLQRGDGSVSVLIR